MPFNSSHFLNLIQKIDSTLIRQKQLTNYMLYYITQADSITPLWEREILSTSQENKLYMLQSASDVIIQSYRHTETSYQIAMAVFFRDNFPQFVGTITDRNILLKIKYIIDYWLDQRIYAADFYSLLLRGIDKRYFILDNPDNEYLIEENAEKVLQLFNGNALAMKMIEMNVEEENIKLSYDSLDYTKIERLIQKSSVSKDKEEIRKMNYQLDSKIEKLQMFKEMLMKDLCKREGIMMNIANIMEKESNACIKMNESLLKQINDEKSMNH